MKTKLLLILSLLVVASARAETRSVMTYSNSAVLYTPAGTSNFWVANSNGINAVISHPELGASNSTYASSNYFASLSTNVSATLDGFKMSPAVSTATTNSYWWDFGKTNALGQKLIYATLNATNTVNFLGATNGQLWSLLSVGVLANGADRNILFPTNLPFFSTNNMTLTNGAYLLTLSNNTLLRFTLESNEFGLESQWVVKP